MYTKEYQVPTYTGEHFCATRTITKTLVLTFLTRVHTCTHTCTYVYIRAQVGRCAYDNLCNHKVQHNCPYVYRWVGCVADTTHTSILVLAYTYVHTCANMYIHVHTCTWVCTNMCKHVHGHVPTWLCAGLRYVVMYGRAVVMCPHGYVRGYARKCAWLCPYVCMAMSVMSTRMVMSVCKHIYVCYVVMSVMPVRSKPWLYTCKTCVVMPHV